MKSSEDVFWDRLHRVLTWLMTALATWSLWRLWCLSRK